MGKFFRDWKCLRQETLLSFSTSNIQLNESGLVYENQPITPGLIISWDVRLVRNTVLFDFSYLFQHSAKAIFRQGAPKKDKINITNEPIRIKIYLIFRWS